jgi:hypothetical protein
VSVGVRERGLQAGALRGQAHPSQGADGTRAQRTILRLQRLAQRVVDEAPVLGA